MKKAVALFLFALAPLSASAVPVRYTFDMGPSDVTSGGTGSLYWDADTQLISNLGWDFGGGLVGGVDDSLAQWSNVFNGGTIAAFTFSILTGQPVHPAGCGVTSGCASGFFAFNGLFGFPSTNMGFALSNTGDRNYQIRFADNVTHQGFLSAATVAPVSVPEPGALSLIAAGLAGIFCVRRRRSA